MRFDFESNRAVSNHVQCLTQTRETNRLDSFLVVVFFLSDLVAVCNVHLEGIAAYWECCVNQKSRVWLRLPLCRANPTGRVFELEFSVRIMELGEVAIRASARTLSPTKTRSRAHV